MSSRRTSNKVLEALEEVACDAMGERWPIAWALGFLVDNHMVLRKALIALDRRDLAEDLRKLVKETRTGEFQ